jgi:hypothetical protein
MHSAFCFFVGLKSTPVFVEKCSVDQHEGGVLFRYLGPFMVILGAVLFFSLVGVWGTKIILVEYATFLSPRASPTRIIRNRAWRWGRFCYGTAIGLAIAVAGIGIAALTVGSLFNNIAPSELESAGFRVFVGTFVAAYWARFVWICLVDYMNYRNETNFRIWFTSVHDRPLAIAHRYYFLGWTFHATEKAMRAIAQLGIGIAAMAFVAGAIHDERGLNASSDWMKLGAALGAAVLITVFRRVALEVWTFLRPEFELSNLCTAPTSRLDSRSAQEKIKLKVNRPGDWRDPSHRGDFRVADLVEWCSRSMRGKFAQDNFDQILLAVRRITESLRLHALDLDASETSQRDFQLRRFYALQIVTKRNPMDVVAAIAELTKDEPEPPQLPKRRAARVVESVSSAINQHWPAFKVVLALIAIIVLVAFGKYTDILGLLKP